MKLRSHARNPPPKTEDNENKEEEETRKSGKNNIKVKRFQEKNVEKTTSENAQNELNINLSNTSNTTNTSPTCINNDVNSSNQKHRNNKEIESEEDTVEIQESLITEYFPFQKSYNFRKRKSTYVDELGLIRVEEHKPYSMRKRSRDSQTHYFKSPQTRSFDSPELGPRKKIRRVQVHPREVEQEQFQVIERDSIRSGLRPRLVKVKPNSNSSQGKRNKGIQSKESISKGNNRNEGGRTEEEKTENREMEEVENGILEEDEEDDEREEEDGEDEEGLEEEEEEEDELEEEHDLRRSRRQRTVVQRYQPELRPKKKHVSTQSNPSSHSNTIPKGRYHGGFNRIRNKRKSRYNDDSSSEEDDFEHSSNRILSLPINLSSVQSSRKAIHSIHRKADILPMAIDNSVTWESVGGLDDYIRSLKEMVLFPLLYPEVFEKFSISPPRGVLFYGPPGTGKTLLARALANTCSNSSGQRISFFMRKGADCLSKWVGEAERQLRLLFDQAYQMQPSIIFFDELDGLAPVRSSKQDQIHSSIVSTLLALMDGLDSKGQVVVIGATNRIDAIDPALRRPGRFDREFLFTLPSKEARRKIFSIHTKKWNPPISENLIEEISDITVGYCGADLKALSTEAALTSLRRIYPQIYETIDKLGIDLDSISVTREDFLQAMSTITPAAHRASVTYAKKLPPTFEDLRKADCQLILEIIFQKMPFLKKSKVSTSLETSDTPSPFSKTIVYRPRLLIHGESTMGQIEVASGVLYNLEELPIFAIDLTSLIANPLVKTLEEAFVLNYKEALRKVPSVLYLPHIDQWWETGSSALKSIFFTLFQDMDPTLPVLFFATSDVPLQQLPPELNAFFGSDVYELKPPSNNERKQFFENILSNFTMVYAPEKNKGPFPELPKVPLPAKKLNPEVEKYLTEERESVLRELRIILRDILNDLQKERKFQIFWKAINSEQYPNYYEIIKNPIDLSIILDKIDNSVYTTLQMFLDDINLLVSNSVEFNKWSDTLKISNRALSLKDIVLSNVEDIDAELIIACNEITEQMKDGSSPNPPNILSNNNSSTNPLDKNKNGFNPYATRSSSRLRGEEPLDLELPNSLKKKKSKKNNDQEKEKEKEGKGDKEEKENDAIISSPSDLHQDSKEEIIQALSDPNVSSTTESIDKELLTDDQRTDHSKEQNELIFNKHEASQLFEIVIKNTKGFSVEKLIQIRSSIFRLIFENRTNYDKTPLLNQVKEYFEQENLLNKQ